MLRRLTQVQLIPLCLTALPLARFVHTVWKLLRAQITEKGGADEAHEMQVVAAPFSTNQYTPVTRASGVQAPPRASTVDHVRTWFPTGVDGTEALTTVREAMFDSPDTMDITESTTLLLVHEQQASQAAPTVPVAQHALADVSTPTATASHAQPVAEEYRSRGAPARNRAAGLHSRRRERRASTKRPSA
jgi:hypothetical protein